MAITKYILCFNKISYAKIYLSAILVSIKRLFNKEIKFISFEASKKHVGVHSIFLLYLSSPFLKKLLYEMKEILSVCVTQEITGEK